MIEYSSTELRMQVEMTR
ncbi:Protein of unknown function [Pyronema omphalodes CBS 100304]|uniref:Uncharacterized protein n=1 Tax=Pyronema omphalodes (strain CBS 100304) TaxID=1076935 RepID=U4L5L0_PYROM|nr:Protein of unknown function [Pyronema omphalodes CBS 100304]